MLKTPTSGELRGGLVRPDRPPSLPSLRSVHTMDGSAHRASIRGWGLGGRPRAASFLLPRREVIGMRSEASASRPLPAGSTGRDHFRASMARSSPPGCNATVWNSTGHQQASLRRAGMKIRRQDRLEVRKYSRQASRSTFHG